MTDTEKQQTTAKKPAAAVSAASKTSAKAPAPIIPGATVRVHQRIKEGDKERTQVFEGIIIARRGKDPKRSSITVRKVSSGIGVEKIFPLALPTVAKIDVVKQARVRRAKLYYLRSYRKKLEEHAV